MTYVFLLLFVLVVGFNFLLLLFLLLIIFFGVVFFGVISFSLLAILISCFFIIIVVLIGDFLLLIFKFKKVRPHTYMQLRAKRG
jgi:hypothetical protein